MVENDKPLPHWKAGPGKVLVYRPIKDELSPEVGFIKIKPGSHLMTNPREIRDIRDEDIRLKTDETLILDGDMVINWPKPGGGLCMLQVIKKRQV